MRVHYTLGATLAATFAFGCATSESGPSLEQSLSDARRDFAGPMPLFRYTYGDRQGNVWLSEPGFGSIVAKTYSVISSEGVWLGTVEFPTDIRLLDISDDRVLGVEMDAFDVQALVLYEILKASQP